MFFLKEGVNGNLQAQVHPRIHFYLVFLNNHFFGRLSHSCETELRELIGNKKRPLSSKITCSQSPDAQGHALYLQKNLLGIAEPLHSYFVHKSMSLIIWL